MEWIVEWTFEGSLKLYFYLEYGLSGTEPVINQECMLVHEKVDIFVNLSGTAIIRVDFITVSNRKVWGGFLIHRKLYFL